MKVILINGSRREKGCTYTALSVIADTLKENGIDSEIIHIGKKALNGEMDEIVKEVGEKMAEADGIVLGSPVYYASPSGEIIAFCDRLYGKYLKNLTYKPGAAIASARRAGTTASLDVLNKYILFNNQPLIASNYWNVVHGSKPEDVLMDEEGAQTMKGIGTNMAWVLKSIEAGKNAGVEQPLAPEKIYTNYIR